ncbi:MAG: TetR/AcrR family transcriptional regulator [Gammaproteobacteria bacterium]|nr:TetR/AcrR family transcriptional regulator [Gammaproteobacteria bacterium]MBU1507403.1 TetR/AcrR family transcriptional regulator [Gammaproteobacteria bacterium]MBU2122818.1 TetR/AcrR family transcriptional regulator [Gammaproteobacteria bacterium]MBU2170533.1 TetR/AcrR family transcriptional regulator [Gammaproteobacteria bacterium]MBU2202336.1 TetR/AcrR family transcriptional regulator [Gammaproteobacteria bacterium]
MNVAPNPSRLTDRKRDAIVQAAIAEFREHGFNGTSMDRVAAAAEVSKRTVYNHFPSKEELFEAILGQLWERSQSLADVPYDTGRPLREQLLELLGQKMQLLGDASFIDLSRVAMAEMMHSPERAQAMVARLSEKEEGLPRWIRAAQEGNALQAVDPQYAANQLHGMVKSFAFWPQLAMGRPPLSAAQQQQVLADAVDMFLGFYALAPGQPARKKRPQ